MQHRFLEDEEAEIAAANRQDREPVEVSGFTSIAGAIGRAVAVAGAAFQIAPNCDSPIEAMLGAHLKLLIDKWNAERTPELTLVPQYELVRFRYDFGIVAGGKLVAAIECDGKDFHSSNEARANDAAKNVAIWKTGAEIFRFSGSQIFRRDVGCVAGIETFLRGRFA